MSHAKSISKRALCVNHDALTSPAQALPQNASHTDHRARCGRGCGGSAVRLLLPGFCGSAVRLRLRKRCQTAGAPPTRLPAAARGNLALQHAPETWRVGNGGPGGEERVLPPQKHMCSTHCVRMLARLRAMSLRGQLERLPSQSERRVAPTRSRAALPMAAARLASCARASRRRLGSWASGSPRPGEPRGARIGQHGGATGIGGRRCNC